MDFNIEFVFLTQVYCEPFKKRQELKLKNNHIET